MGLDPGPLALQQGESKMKRYNVNKGKSAGHFKRNVKRTKAINMAGPMRGGIRL